MTGYLTWLADRVDLVVVDNSGPDIFASNSEAWRHLFRHVPPDPDFPSRHHKVANVLTGLRLARHDTVIVADDDVRWDEVGLVRAAAMARQASVVRPQNYFSPLPWHARWDTARILLNRATGADYPGTLVVHRSALEATAGYDGDTLFENLELMRTVEAAGGRVLNAPDLFVRRLPPSTRHFWSQRIRQAYDEFAVPLRMSVWLAIVPLVGAMWIRHRRIIVAGIAMASVLLAETGRRRGHGRQVFPATGSLLAPIWLAERAVCAWLAVGARFVRGGIKYNGTVLRRAAHSRRELRRRVITRTAGQRVAVLGAIR